MMLFIQILCLLSSYFIHIEGSIQATHWMVTESGLIQPRLNSPFEMARPYDLLAFLNQDTRWENIKILYHELSKRQLDIDNIWEKLDKESQIQKFIETNENCLKAEPLNTLEWYQLMDGKSKKIVEKEFSGYVPQQVPTDVPDCKKISSLTFSMFAFEHLESMVQRENISIDSDITLPEMISPVMILDEFGHWSAAMLRRNTSSWLHYNMAALYWRIAGNGAKAIECSRRAVHYAPRVYKDVALLTLGTILHHGKKTEDAITVLGAAVDHDPHYPINNFILANAFAVLGDFNTSLKYYEISLKLDPNFGLAVRHKNGVICHAYLLKKIVELQELLHKLKAELVEYSLKEAQWLTSQAAFLRTMKHDEDFDYRNVENNCQKMTELTGLNIKELKKSGDKNSLIQYFIDGPMFSDIWLTGQGVHSIEAAYSLQRLISHIEKHSSKSNFVVQAVDMSDKTVMKELGPIPGFSDILRDKLSHKDDTDSGTFKTVKVEEEVQEKKKNDISEYEGGVFLYPTTLKINRNREDFDRDPTWPSDDVCIENAPYFPDNVEAVFPLFLPFENKGLRLKSLLTHKIGVAASQEYEVPWYPPICPRDKDAATILQKKLPKQSIVGEVIDTQYLRKMLLQYVTEGEELERTMEDAEIGHRIYVATQMEMAPKWLLSTLTSLYWRVRGKNANAVHCLQSAAKSVEIKYKDIVLVSLASVLLEMGYFEEALIAAEQSYRISLYEPSTNFLLFELNMLKKHRNAHMFHLKQVVRVTPRFMDSIASHLLYAWGCILKQVLQKHEIEFSDVETCKEIDRELSLLCEKEGINCHLSSLKHCMKGQEIKDTSTLTRIMNKYNDYPDIRKDKSKVDDDLDGTIFDKFINNKPEYLTDIEGHIKNYEAMRKTLNEKLRGCGPRGCHSIRPEDLSLTEEECSTDLNSLLSYWLHIICFVQVLSDEENLRISEEPIAKAKNIPECRKIDPNENFILNRLSLVDTDNWKPIHRQVAIADMWNFDYVSFVDDLSKISESMGWSWLNVVVASWLCGVEGRGACCVRCTGVATRAPSAHRTTLALRPLIGLLLAQSKYVDAKEVAYLGLYLSPKSKVEAFLVAVSHTYLGEHEQAVWMYLYALSFDDKFLPAKACLHASMCLMLYGKTEQD